MCVILHVGREGGKDGRDGSDDGNIVVFHNIKICTYIYRNYEKKKVAS
jgi:hypothetical protein